MKKRTVAQTPAPAKDIIKGSSINKKLSATKEEASTIELSERTIKVLQDKLKAFKEKHPNNTSVTLNDLKAVYRRGSGAYSTSHRPNITRAGWSYARVNKFLEKAGGNKVKETYVQDDDLLKYEQGGKVKTYWYKGLFESNYFEKLDNYKEGGNIDKEYNDYVKRVYDLAVFNSKLVKGYKKYKSEKDEQDYEEKNKELKKLVDIAIKNNYEIHRNSDVIYFVIDGIQISFHYPSDFRNQGVISFNELPNENNYQWDGVKNAFKYSKEEYEKLKKERAEILNIRKLYVEELRNEFVEEGKKLINYYNKNLKRTKNPKTREYYEDKIEYIGDMIEYKSPYRMRGVYQLYNEKNIYFGEIGKELDKTYPSDYIYNFSLG
jgi:hypothetical protein